MRQDESRRELLAGLRRRREEIVATVTTRVQAIDPPDRTRDYEYQKGLRAAIEAAVDTTVEAAASESNQNEPVPGPILSQARLAARNRVPIETVLRRYQAGHMLLGDFVLDEAVGQGAQAGILRGVLRAQAARTDQVVAAISRSYVEEARATRPLSIDGRRMVLIRRLLDGELVDVTSLDYDLDRWNLALVIKGETDGILDSLPHSFDARQLATAGEEETLWIWLGSRERLDPHMAVEAIRPHGPDGTRVGVGEPGRGRSGWRLTHDQAKAALTVAIYRGTPCARYADVALLAAAIGDELLSTSLRQLYLEPLERERSGGAVLRNTLLAYFECEHNVSSTAASLGVSRQTVTNRLRAAGERLGHPLTAAGTEMQLALRLQLCGGKGMDGPC
jgi:hypothetical protein